MAVEGGLKSFKYSVPQYNVRDTDFLGGGVTKFIKNVCSLMVTYMKRRFLFRSKPLSRIISEEQFMRVFLFFLRNLFSKYIHIKSLF